MMMSKLLELLWKGCALEPVMDLWTNTISQQPTYHARHSLGMSNFNAATMS